MSATSFARLIVKAVLINVVVFCIMLVLPYPLPETIYHPTNPAALSDSATLGFAEGVGLWNSGEGHPLPSHVLVTTPHGDLVYSTNLVTDALDQIFTGTDHGLVIHGFSA